MKVRINNKCIILFMVAAIGISSCKKLIEIPPSPINEIPQGAVFSDSSDIMSAIAGVYISFHINDGSEVIFNGMLTQFMGLAAGEINDTYGDAYQTNTYIATDGTAQQFWETAYSELYKINSCIEGISSTNAISDSLKNSLIGELKVVRALHYFYLANLFGNVPIVSSTDYKVNTNLARSSIDSVYNFIISDLTSARQVLVSDYPSDGRARPNLYTADALLARVYLYRGGYMHKQTHWQAK